MTVSKKTGTKFWESRVFRHHGTSADGLFYAKLQYGGRRETFCTRCTTRPQAAAVARDICMELRTLGWAATLKKRKPEAEQKSVTTVGDFIDAVKSQYVGQNRTIEDYGRNFRRLVADLFNIERPAKEKFDYVNGGRLAWIQKVNAIPLVDITPQKIQAWRVAYLNRAGDNLEKRRKAQSSVNAVLRLARSLFAQKRLELMVFDPPLVSPFEKIKLEPEGDMRYRGTVDAVALVKRALTELADRPELLKAFLLAICAGLRRAEVDRLEWSAFDWTSSTIHVGPTQYLHVKSKKSIGDVDLDEETCALFRGYYARRQSNFVSNRRSSRDPGRPIRIIAARRFSRRCALGCAKRGSIRGARFTICAGNLVP
jgi:integrase